MKRKDKPARQRDKKDKKVIPATISRRRSPRSGFSQAMHPIPRYSTTRTILWFVALVLVVQFAPIPIPDQWKVLPNFKETFLVKGLKDNSSFSSNPLSAFMVMAPEPVGTNNPNAVVSSDALARTTPTSGLIPAQKRIDLPDVCSDPSSVLRGEVLPIEQGCIDPEGRDVDHCKRFALDPFYEALARTDRKEAQAITRIVHFGDSIIASDYISATAREVLQRLWGDAGHGFLMAAKPFRWYEHKGVVLHTSGKWLVHSVVYPRFGDRLFGLGGVYFETLGQNTVDFGTVDGTTSVSRFEIYYQEQPGGGSIDVLVNGKAYKRLSTSGNQVRSTFFVVEVADGSNNLTLRTVGDGKVRLFGVTLERSMPGIIYDSIGLIGSSMQKMKQIDREHWIAQLKHRAPDLLIFTFGANESPNYKDAVPKVLENYEQLQVTMIRELRAALPETSILVMGPLDLAERDANGELVTRPSIPKILEAQRRAALSSGAAFWNTFSVMGGEGSMARWAHNGLGLSDLTHPSWKGAVKLGNELACSITAGFQQYEQRRSP